MCPTGTPTTEPPIAPSQRHGHHCRSQAVVRSRQNQHLGPCATASEGHPSTLEPASATPPHKAPPPPRAYKITHRNPSCRTCVHRAGCECAVKVEYIHVVNSEPHAESRIKIAIWINRLLQPPTLAFRPLRAFHNPPNANRQRRPEPCGLKPHNGPSIGEIDEHTRAGMTDTVTIFGRVPVPRTLELPSETTILILVRQPPLRG
jgi:hypothetical protein